MPAFRSGNTLSHQYYDHDAADEDLSCALDPGERIGGPVASRRRKLIWRSCIVVVLTGAGAWVWLNHAATVSEWTAFVVAAVSPVLARPETTSAESRPPLPPVHEIARTESLPLPAATAAPLPPETTVASEEPSAPEEDVAPDRPERLPPPVADPADPYQAKALAAGLHPGLSPVLLTRLTPTDYRNAKIAISTALAETPDADIFVWPRQRTSDLALFRVKFVAGAPTDCRRYVVTVTKDNWLTTALPMEKCGELKKEVRKQ